MTYLLLSVIGLQLSWEPAQYTPVESKSSMPSPYYLARYLIRMVMLTELEVPITIRIRGSLIKPWKTITSHSVHRLKITSHSVNRLKITTRWIVVFVNLQADHLGDTSYLSVHTYHQRIKSSYPVWEMLQPRRRNSALKIRKNILILQFHDIQEERYEELM